MKTSVKIAACILYVSFLSACTDARENPTANDIAHTHPSILSVLHGHDIICNRVILLDLSDTHTVSVRGANSTIVNLNARLIVAERMTLTPIKDNTRVRLELFDGIVSRSPCFQDTQYSNAKLVGRLGTYKREYLLSDIIRINGIAMTYENAAKKYQELPLTSVRHE